VRSEPEEPADREGTYADMHRHGGGQIWTGWRAACRRAGIADLRPHDLRHTCSTWLTRLGVHEQVRDQIIGHYSSSMGRRYSHVPRPDITAAIDKLPWRAVDLDPDEVMRAKARRVRSRGQTTIEPRTPRTDHALP